MELLREIFLYSIEGNRKKSGDLASVCRHWWSVITSIASLWSTLRVGTWTEKEQVATWLQRAYPKKVVIDIEEYCEHAPNIPFSALEDAFASTGQWNELTISSFPCEDLASQLGFQSRMPMSVLKTLQVVAACVRSPSFTHILDLIPTEAPLSELRLYSSFATAHFLQPHWFPVLQNLTVLIVNGKDIHEQFELLPTFTSFRYSRLITFLSHYTSSISICHSSVLFRSCDLEPPRSNGWPGDGSHPLRIVQFSFLDIGRQFSSARWNCHPARN